MHLSRTPTPVANSTSNSNENEITQKTTCVSNKKPATNSQNCSAIENTENGFKPAKNGIKLVFKLMSSTEQTAMVLENTPKTATVHQCKLALANQYKLEKKQSWYCAGKLLKNELTLRDAKIPQDFVIQVHLT